MQDLNDLFYFAAVIDHGGFAPAGRALGLPKSKLSRRISALEERLGVRLIQRSTRRFAITEIGEVYYRHCKAMVVEAEAAQDAVDQVRTEPCGTVRLACPIALLHAAAGAMLGDFLTRYPRVRLELDATNRHVDVVGERFDLALRARTPPLADSDLAHRVLHQAPQRLVASPTLLARLGEVRGPADLHGVPSLDWGPASAEHVWRLQGPEGAGAEVPHEPVLVSDDLETLRDAALAGAGVAQLPVLMCADLLRAGKLAAIPPGWAPRSDLVHAVFPTRRGLMPSVRALVDFLAEGFERLAADSVSLVPR